MRSVMPLLARDVMHTPVLSVPSDMLVADLGDFLITHRIGGVPVVDHGALVGIVSRSDIVCVAARARSLAGIALGGIGRAESAPAEAPEPVALVRGASRAADTKVVRDIMVVDAVTVAPETP